VTPVARAARARRIVWLGVRIATSLVLLERRRGQMPPAAFERHSAEVLRREAVRLRDAAVELQGLLIKLGQFLSTRVDVLPAAFTRELAQLRDMVPGVPWDRVRAVAEAELGRPLEEVFASIDSAPVASASLGQVHRAVTQDGATVAVKVQRPGIDELIEVDLRAVLTVVRWARRLSAVERRVDLLALYRELARTTREELDYVLEAEHAERFARNFVTQGDVVVPAIDRRWSGRRLLVMEFVEGIPVDDRAGLEAAGLTPSQTAERLLATYLQQVLRDGFFHADPHPGNVFVDGSGRLIYIDFGMMGEITPRDRQAMGNFAAGVVRRDLDLLVRSLSDLGFLRPHAEAEPLKRAMGTVLDQMTGVQWNRPQGAAFEDFLEDMREFLRTEPFQLPTQYTFLGRAAGILLGITASLDPNLDMVRILREHAFGYLGLEGGGTAASGGGTAPPDAAPGGARRGGGQGDVLRRELRNLALLLYRLPHRLDRILERLESGDVRLRVELGSVARRLEDQNRVQERRTRAWLTIAAGAVSAWLLRYGHIDAARLGFLVTAALLVWTVRLGRGGPGPRG
jgi:predicted unusual protein kinase regulating ubiquinone biosynthesis (AarF/ABC1/UbiB family)